MKIQSKTALTVFFLLVITLYSQQGSSIEYKSGSGIFIGSGAVIYSNQVIISGTQSGTGNFCTDSYLETGKLFSAVTQNNNVILSWKFESELNNSGIYIERKTETGNWVNLAFVNGSGTTNHPVEYTYEDNKLQPGKYFYRLKQIDYNGNFEYFELSLPVLISKPKSFSIGQNYPNPSNPKCRIDYQLPERVMVNISVYDILGKRVATLVNEEKNAGIYTTEFDGTNIASGTYLYIITAGSFKEIKKLVLVK